MLLSWYSNAPWKGSGYGTQTAQMIPRLVAAGHDLAIINNFGLMGMLGEWQGVPVYPAGGDKYSNDVFLAHHMAHTKGKPSWLITLFDTWVFNRAQCKDVHIASWTPVDHMPVEPAVVDWAKEHYTIAMSRYGQAQFESAGVQARYAPHGIEKVYCPTETTEAGVSGRAAMGLPDDAFVVMVNANNAGNHPPRKAWGEMLVAFGAFAQTHPDAYLYLHTHKTGFSGVDIPQLLRTTMIPEGRVRFVEQYPYVLGTIGQRDMAALYTAADVLLATSYGEGFGLPVMEAQACGTPVIVSDFTAQPELIGAGWKVPVQPWWDTPHAAFFGIPMIGGIIRALEEAYERRGDPQLKEQALAKAAEYDADLVFDTYWRPILAELESLLLPRKVRRAKAGKKR